MLEWTGERYIPYIDPSISGAQVHYEHLHRYAFASLLVKKKTVLDLASGEGYGTFILSKSAKFVIGVEIDRDTVYHASSTYNKKNIEFIQASILNIPIDGEKKFDVIICFEAIEHIKDHNALFHEIKRLLRDDGFLIISTPNKKIYTDDSGYLNPYHKNELYYSEFLDLLKNNFSHIALFGQKVIIGSSIYPLSSKNISLCNEFIIEQEEHNFSFKEDSEIDPLYFVAIASMVRLDKNKIKKSYLIDKSNTIISLFQTQMCQCNTSIQSLDQALTAKNQQVQQMDEHAKGLCQLLADHKKEIADLTSRLQLADTYSQELSQLVADRKKEIADLTSRLQLADTYSQELSQLVADREKETLYLTNLLKDVTAQTGLLENTLINQKLQIEALINEINNINLHAYGLKQKLSYREVQIADLTNQVQQVTLHAQGLEQISNENRNNYQLSTHFVLAERIIGTSNYLLNTCRNYYKLSLKAFDILSHEGIGKLYWHYCKRKQVKKFETDIQRKKNDRKIQLKPHVLTSSEFTQIQFPVINNEVEVSIIIPVHNKFQYTFNCLHSISEKTHGAYEVLIVDDASTDETVSQLKNITNLSIIRNNVNLGFVESCNKGAKSSQGKNLLFLNNDTVVTENWLPPLLDLIKKDDVGAVGSKLIYPNGVLQEAGGIIWNDASGWNYGRGDNSEKPEYNFVRNVDYCSGAALLVKKDIFERIGGLDKQFIPAYYEDTDLCFSIRKLGYRVLYQPMSVVIHFEGITSGTNITEGVKQNQIINKDKFFQKWKGILQTSHFAPDSRNLFAARSRSSGKKILVIDQYIPFFDRDAGSYRMFNILKILGELGHKVTFIGDNFNQFDPYDTIMEQSGIEVIYSPFITSIKQYLSQFGENFDIVIVSRPYIAQKHIAHIRKYCNHAKVIYDTVDLQFLRESRMAEIKKDPHLLLQADNSKKIELQLARMSDVTLVVSTIEQEILTTEDPLLNVQVISLIHDIILPTKNFAQRHDILFLGAFLHTPNTDGVLWFIQDIFPAIKKQKPEIKIFIVGDRPPKEIMSLSSENIIITGYVEDLTEYFNNCRVFVAPLRYGAGVKGKINQSMSRGLPVVTTSIGAEGMGITDGENVLIADNPDMFSQKVIQLYDDENLWNKISDNSIDHIRKNTSYDQSKKRIKEFISTL